MAFEDPMAWSDECEEATDGHHFDYHYNSQTLWACTNEAGVTPEHFDDGRGYRCRVTWWIPDADYPDGKRCEDTQARCFHEECVNPQDLQIMANRVYQEVQTRQCMVKENSVEQECKCCCNENMEVMIDCDWVKKLDDGSFNVTTPRTILAFSTITASAEASSELDWGLFVGLTATISLLLIALGWGISWYLSPTRRGYRKDVDEDYLPPLPGTSVGPSATPQKGGSKPKAARDVSDSGDASSLTGSRAGTNAAPSFQVRTDQLTPFADEDDENEIAV